MFDSIGWSEILVIVVAALFILGPERLPSAAAWLGRTVRQVREYASGARDQLRSELGPEFDELRQPLEDLRSLRDLNPRRAITKHLFDGYDPTDDLRQFDIRDDLRLDGDRVNGSTTASDEKPNGYPLQDSPARALQPGERAPFDPDAT